MLKNEDYRPGNPEYDYWNDKNLYPSLRGDEDNFQSKGNATSSSEDAGIGFGSVFVAIFGWMFVFAPLAFFFTWEDWIVQVVFWGGIAIILLIFVVAFYNAVQEEKRKKS